jgi:hypothetical protein
MVGSTTVSNAAPRDKTKGLIFTGILSFSFYQHVIGMSQIGQVVFLCKQGK